MLSDSTLEEEFSTIPNKRIESLGRSFRAAYVSYFCTVVDAYAKEFIDMGHFSFSRGVPLGRSTSINNINNISSNNITEQRTLSSVAGSNNSNNTDRQSIPQYVSLIDYLISSVNRRNKIAMHQNLSSSHSNSNISNSNSHQCPLMSLEKLVVQSLRIYSSNTDIIAAFSAQSYMIHVISFVVTAVNESTIALLSNTTDRSRVVPSSSNNNSMRGIPSGLNSSGLIPSFRYDKALYSDSYKSFSKDSDEFISSAINDKGALEHLPYISFLVRESSELSVGKNRDALYILTELLPFLTQLTTHHIFSNIIYNPEVVLSAGTGFHTSSPSSNENYFNIKTETPESHSDDSLLFSTAHNDQFAAFSRLCSVDPEYDREMMCSAAGDVWGLVKMPTDTISSSSSSETKDIKTERNLIKFSNILKASRKAAIKVATATATARVMAAVLMTAPASFEYLDGKLRKAFTASFSDAEESHQATGFLTISLPKKLANTNTGNIISSLKRASTLLLSQLVDCFLLADSNLIEISFAYVLMSQPYRFLDRNILTDIFSCPEAKEVICDSARHYMAVRGQSISGEYDEKPMLLLFRAMEVDAREFLFSKSHGSGNRSSFVSVYLKHLQSCLANHKNEKANTNLARAIFFLCRSMKYTSSKLHCNTDYFARTLTFSDLLSAEILSIALEMGKLSNENREIKYLICLLIVSVFSSSLSFKGFALLSQATNQLAHKLFHSHVKRWYSKDKHLHCGLPCASVLICLLDRNEFVTESLKVFTTLIRVVGDTAKWNKLTRGRFIRSMGEVMGFYCTFIIRPFDTSNTRQSTGSSDDRVTLETNFKTMVVQFRDLCTGTLRKGPSSFSASVSSNPQRNHSCAKASPIVDALSDVLISLALIRPITFGLPLLLDLIPGCLTPLSSPSLLAQATSLASNESSLAAICALTTITYVLFNQSSSPERMSIMTELPLYLTPFSESVYSFESLTPMEALRSPTKTTLNDYCDVTPIFIPEAPSFSFIRWQTTQGGASLKLHHIGVNPSNPQNDYEPLLANPLNDCSTFAQVLEHAQLWFREERYFPTRHRIALSLETLTFSSSKPQNNTTKSVDSKCEEALIFSRDLLEALPINPLPFTEICLMCLANFGFQKFVSDLTGRYVSILNDYLKSANRGWKLLPSSEDYEINWRAKLKDGASFSFISSSKNMGDYFYLQSFLQARALSSVTTKVGARNEIMTPSYVNTYHKIVRGLVVVLHALERDVASPSLDKSVSASQHLYHSPSNFIPFDVLSGNIPFKTSVKHTNIPPQQPYPYVTEGAWMKNPNTTILSEALKRYEKYESQSLSFSERDILYHHMFLLACVCISRWNPSVLIMNSPLTLVLSECPTVTSSSKQNESVKGKTKVSRELSITISEVDDSTEVALPPAIQGSDISSSPPLIARCCFHLNRPLIRNTFLNDILPYLLHRNDFMHATENNSNLVDALNSVETFNRWANHQGVISATKNKEWRTQSAEIVGATSSRRKNRQSTSLRVFQVDDDEILEQENCDSICGIASCWMRQWGMTVSALRVHLTGPYWYHPVHSLDSRLVGEKPQTPLYRGRKETSNSQFFLFPVYRPYCWLWSHHEQNLAQILITKLCDFALWTQFSEDCDSFSVSSLSARQFNASSSTALKSTIAFIDHCIFVICQQAVTSDVSITINGNPIPEKPLSSLSLLSFTHPTQAIIRYANMCHSEAPVISRASSVTTDGSSSLAHETQRSIVSIFGTYFWWLQPNAARVCDNMVHSPCALAGLVNPSLKIGSGSTSLITNDLLDSTILFLISHGDPAVRFLGFRLISRVDSLVQITLHSKGLLDLVLDQITLTRKKASVIQEVIETQLVKNREHKVKLQRSGVAKGVNSLFPSVVSGISGHTEHFSTRETMYKSLSFLTDIREILIRQQVIGHFPEYHTLGSMETPLRDRKTLLSALQTSGDMLVQEIQEIIKSTTVYGCSWGVETYSDQDSSSGNRSTVSSVIEGVQNQLTNMFPHTKLRLIGSSSPYERPPSTSIDKDCEQYKYASDRVASCGDLREMVNVQLFEEALLATDHPLVLVITLLKYILPRMNATFQTSLEELCFLAFPQRTASSNNTRYINFRRQWGNGLSLDNALFRSSNLFHSPAYTAEHINLKYRSSMDAWRTHFTFVALCLVSQNNSKVLLEREIAELILNNRDYLSRNDTICCFSISSRKKTRHASFYGRCYLDDDSLPDPMIDNPQTKISQLENLFQQTIPVLLERHHSWQDIYYTLSFVLEQIFIKIIQNGALHESELSLLPAPASLANVFLDTATRIYDTTGIKIAAKKDVKKALSLSSPVLSLLRIALRLICSPPPSMQTIEWPSSRKPKQDNLSCTLSAITFSVHEPGSLSIDTSRYSSKQITGFRIQKGYKVPENSPKRTEHSPISGTRAVNEAQNNNDINRSVKLTYMFPSSMNANLQLVKLFDIFDNIVEILLNASSGTVTSGNKQLGTVTTSSHTTIVKHSKEALSRKCGVAAGGILPPLPPFCDTELRDSVYGSGRIVSCWETNNKGRGPELSWECSTTLRLRETIIDIITALSKYALSDTSNLPGADTCPFSLGSLVLRTKSVIPEASSACRNQLSGRLMTYMDFLSQHALHLIGPALSISISASYHQKEPKSLENTKNNNNSSSYFNSVSRESPLNLFDRVMMALSMCTDLYLITAAARQTQDPKWEVFLRSYCNGVANQLLSHHVLQQQLLNLSNSAKVYWKTVSCDGQTSQPNEHVFYLPPSMSSMSLSEFILDPFSLTFTPVLILIIDRMLESFSLSSANTLDWAEKHQKQHRLSQCSFIDSPVYTNNIILLSSADLGKDYTSTYQFLSRLIVHSPAFGELLIEKIILSSTIQERNSQDKPNDPNQFASPAHAVLFEVSVKAILALPTLLLRDENGEYDSTTSVSMGEIGNTGKHRASVPMWPSMDPASLFETSGSLPSLVLYALYFISSSGGLVSRDATSPDTCRIMSHAEEVIGIGRNFLSFCVNIRGGQPTNPSSFLHVAPKREIALWMHELNKTSRISHSLGTQSSEEDYPKASPDTNFFQKMWSIGVNIFLNDSTLRLHQKAVFGLLSVLAEIPAFTPAIGHAHFMRQVILISKELSSGSEQQSIVKAMWKAIEMNSCPREEVISHVTVMTNLSDKPHGKRVRLIGSPIEQLCTLLICGSSVFLTPTSSRWSNDSLNLTSEELEFIINKLKDQYCDFLQEDCLITDDCEELKMCAAYLLSRKSEAANWRQDQNRRKGELYNHLQHRKYRISIDKLDQDQTVNTVIGYCKGTFIPRGHDCILVTLFKHTLLILRCLRACAPYIRSVVETVPSQSNEAPCVSLFKRVFMSSSRSPSAPQKSRRELLAALPCLMVLNSRGSLSDGFVRNISYSYQLSIGVTEENEKKRSAFSDISFKMHCLKVLTSSAPLVLSNLQCLEYVIENEIKNRWSVRCNFYVSQVLQFYKDISGINTDLLPIEYLNENDDLVRKLLPEEIALTLPHWPTGNKTTKLLLEEEEVTSIFYYRTLDENRKREESTEEMKSRNEDSLKRQQTQLVKNDDNDEYVINATGTFKMKKRDTCVTITALERSLVNEPYFLTTTVSTIQKHEYNNSPGNDLEKSGSYKIDDLSEAVTVSNENGEDCYRKKQQPVIKDFSVGSDISLVNEGTLQSVPSRNESNNPERTAKEHGILNVKFNNERVKIQSVKYQPQSKMLGKVLVDDFYENEVMLMVAIETLDSLEEELTLIILSSQIEDYSQCRSPPIKNNVSIAMNLAKIHTSHQPLRSKIRKLSSLFIFALLLRKMKTLLQELNVSLFSKTSSQSTQKKDKILMLDTSGRVNSISRISRKNSYKNSSGSTKKPNYLDRRCSIESDRTVVDHGCASLLSLSRRSLPQWCGAVGTGGVTRALSGSFSTTSDDKRILEFIVSSYDIIIGHAELLITVEEGQNGICHLPYSSETPSVITPEHAVRKIQTLAKTYYVEMSPRELVNLLEDLVVTIEADVFRIVELINSKDTTIGIISVSSIIDSISLIYGILSYSKPSLGSINSRYFRYTLLHMVALQNSISAVLVKYAEEQNIRADCLSHLLSHIIFLVHFIVPKAPMLLSSAAWSMSERQLALQCIYWSSWGNWCTLKNYSNRISQGDSLLRLSQILFLIAPYCNFNSLPLSDQSCQSLLTVFPCKALPSPHDKRLNSMVSFIRNPVTWADIFIVMRALQQNNTRCAVSPSECFSTHQRLLSYLLQLIWDQNNIDTTLDLVMIEGKITTCDIFRGCFILPLIVVAGLPCPYSLFKHVTQLRAAKVLSMILVRGNSSTGQSDNFWARMLLPLYPSIYNTIQECLSPAFLTHITSDESSSLADIIQLQSEISILFSIVMSKIKDKNDESGISVIDILRFWSELHLLPTTSSSTKSLEMAQQSSIIPLSFLKDLSHFMYSVGFPVVVFPLGGVSTSEFYGPIIDNNAITVPSTTNTSDDLLAGNLLGELLGCSNNSYIRHSSSVLNRKQQPYRFKGVIQVWRRKENNRQSCVEQGRRSTVITSCSSEFKAIWLSEFD